MKVIFSSQFRDSSGYASAARSYLKAIDTVIENYDYEFNVLNISVEDHSAVSDYYENLISKYEVDLDSIDEYIKEDYLLIWHQPAGMVLYGDSNKSKDPDWIAFKKLLNNSTKNINMTVWESDKVPKMWTTIHKKYKTNSVIVPCHENKQIFDETGIDAHLLPHVIDDPIKQPKELKGFPLELDEMFTVFSMSQWINRKGYDALVKAFSMEFNNVPDAIMIIKTYVTAMNTSQFPFNKQAEHIQKEIIAVKNMVLKEGRPSNAKIAAICNVLPYENISWLYSKSDVFALATRGEGFGLTISEAIMHEKPVIVSWAGGHLDYINSDDAFLFKGHKHPYIGDPTYDYDMNWFEPDVLDIRRNLRICYNMWKSNREMLAQKGKNLKQHILSNGYDYKSIGDKFFSIISKEINYKSDNLKDMIKSFSSDRKKLDLLKNKYKGEDCYILSCGPSLNNYSEEFLNKALANKLVFAVKQAYNKAPDVVDFHFFNSNNFELYKYRENRPIVFASSAESEIAMIYHIWSNNQEYDVFNFIPDDRDISKSICKSLNFEEYTYENKIDRPWGPGIMTEMVFYLAVHMGVKNIYTIGWDLEKPGSTKSNHFYKDRPVIRPADDMPKDEINNNINMSKHLCKWLESKGINLYVANEGSYVHDSIPRRILK